MGLRNSIKVYVGEEFVGLWSNTKVYGGKWCMGLKK